MKKILSLIFSFLLIASNLFAGTLEIDWMEGYSTNALAQAAYVTNATPGYGSDIVVDGTPTADSYYSATYSPDKACDKTTGSFWYAYETDLPHWWIYDWGAGVTKVFTKVSIQSPNANEYNPTEFLIQGSILGASWDTLKTVTGETTWSALETKTYTFANTTGYRYLRIYVTATNAPAPYTGKSLMITEIYAYETVISLQSYSSTTHTQGSYSLKGIAVITDSLNETFTKTFAVNHNLAGVKNLWFDARASRTGSNIKLGLHDTGGTTTEITPNIITADTFQKVNWDFSAVSDANKDAIDTLTTTIVNADAANTFYYDYAEIAQAIDVFGWAN